MSLYIFLLSGTQIVSQGNSLSVFPTLLPYSPNRLPRVSQISHSVVRARKRGREQGRGQDNFALETEECRL